MKKQIKKVPKGVKYISEWKDYNIPLGHCIVNKGVTGCGYTEFCLTNKENIILCSPRKLLLENKRDQHVGDENILYLENDITNLDTRTAFNCRISEHIVKCSILHLPIKFMITYDSAHYVIDHLFECNMLDNFLIVADEMQSIFTDAFFKADVENGFLKNIQKCKNVIYLSATPMLDRYLEQLEEFKDLDYYYIDWSESGNISKTRIQYKRTNSLLGEAKKIVSEYLEGHFPVIVDENHIIHFSKEAVFYFNSVREIKSLINKMNLSQDQVNVLCANTPENVKYLMSGKNKVSIGEIPLKGEQHKMFTFCTSTCYIGADFYSPCASTYIFADPNLKNLAVDISLDLPQIMGRQRDKNNLFKEIATIFYKTTRGENLESREEFERVQSERMEKTKILLDEFSKFKSPAKAVFSDVIQKLLNKNCFSDYFVGILPDGTIGYNGLIKLSQERAWEISQKDYKDSISVVKAISNLEIVNYLKEYRDEDDKTVDEFLVNEFFSTGVFEKKMKVFCEFMDKYHDNEYILDSIKYKISDINYHNFYNYFGTARCKALKFREFNLTKALIGETKDDILVKSVYNKFEVGERYSSRSIKVILSEIYKGLNLIDKPKATDLGDWFEVKDIIIIDPLTKKRDRGYELISRKVGD